jgi:hypothetical protein
VPAQLVASQEGLSSMSDDDDDDVSNQRLYGFDRGQIL